VGFEVLTAVFVKSYIFWDITPCSPLKVNRCSGGTYRLHLQCRRISRARIQRSSHQLSRWFLARLILQPWRWRRHVPPKHMLTLNGLHGDISQETELYILRNYILKYKTWCNWPHPPLIHEVPPKFVPIIKSVSLVQNFILRIYLIYTRSLRLLEHWLSNVFGPRPTVKHTYTNFLPHFVYKINKKFWEELIAYFGWYDTGQI
jgi:hypothetical protein